MKKTYAIIHSVIELDRKNIEKIAQTSEDKLLLAKIFDKINNGIQRNIPTNTAFLSQRELSLCKYLFGNTNGIISYGGYEDTQRKILVYLPDYLEEDYLSSDTGPIVCLRASFYEKDAPTHRDFLGALIGAGVARECIGDICVSCDFCDFFVTAEIAQYILQNFDSAGRTKLHLSQIPHSDAVIPSASTVQIQDTVASLRLDSIIAAGFQISRAQAAQYIETGRAAVNGLSCEKVEKNIEGNSTVTVRGLGKICLTSIGGQSKKGRIFVVIDRYV